MVAFESRLGMAIFSSSGSSKDHSDGLLIAIEPTCALTVFQDTSNAVGARSRRKRPLFHCRSLAEPIMFASCGKPKRRKRARALHKAYIVASEPPGVFVQSGFNEVR
jgi:hypothetical protein